MSRNLACACVALLACSSAQRLPPPPPYEPSASPEAQTPCEAERKRAQEGRERLLELDTVASRTDTAAAVFAHAECEKRHFDQREIAAPSQDDMLAKIQAARERYQDAQNLYEEIPRYAVPRWSIGARSRLGALHAAFAAKLRNAPAPQEIDDPGERAKFSTELDSLAAALDRRAVAAFVAAAETASADPALVADDSEVRAWMRTSCDSLASLDPAARAEQAVCSQWSSR